MRGQLVVDGLIEGGVGRRGREGREGLQVRYGMSQGDIGSHESGEGFEVEEHEFVGPGDVDWWGHCCVRSAVGMWTVVRGLRHGLVGKVRTARERREAGRFKRP